VKGQVKGTTTPTSSAKRIHNRGEGDPLKPICIFKDIEKRFSDRILLNYVSGTIHSGAKIGILGINGAGKSSFLKILAKQDDEFDGKLIYDSSICLGYLPQEPNLPETMTGMKGEGIGR
jgi:ATPase subunit of ABC transporter with duplicated ATPase domains